MRCPKCDLPMVAGPKAYIQIREPGARTGFETKGLSCRPCNLTIWPYYFTIGPPDIVIERVPDAEEKSGKEKGAIEEKGRQEESRQEESD